MKFEISTGVRGKAAAPAMAAVRNHATEAATFLRALANDQRLLVLCSLLDGPLSVGEINERVPLSQSALSQHLAILREARLVVTSRHSQTIHYSMARGPALQVMEILYTTFCQPAASKVPGRKTKRRDSSDKAGISARKERA